MRELMISARVGFETLLRDDSSSGSFNMVDKHFASIADFDGNCESDLFMLSKNGSNSYFEFYLKLATGKYEKQKNVMMYSDTIHFLTFLDLDSNGAIDLVMIVSNETGSRKLVVNYN